MTGHSSEPTRRSDALDELTALFLTENDAKRGEQAVKEPAFRELLIVGNLPVRGGVWLTPYADAIARQNGPTALARFDLEPPTLELLWANASAGQASSGMNGSSGGASQPMTLKDAVFRAASEVAVWIVRGPSAMKPADLLSLDFDRITILSSADSAAVVAAYRLIKEVILAAEEASIERPRVALAIAGADEHDAADVVRRMNETSSAQLGVSIELACCLTRMDAGIRCETFASFAEAEPPAVRDLLEWIDEAAGIDAWTRGDDLDHDDEMLPLAEDEQDIEGDRPALRLAPMIDDVNADEREVLPADDEDPDHEAPEDVSGWDEPEAAPEIENFAHEPARPSADDVRLAPKPAAHAPQEPKMGSLRSTNHVAMALTSFVAGLSPLPVRCPANEEIELAADEEGRVHVLAREGLLRELRVVETWAKAHRQLIAMACPDRRIEAEGETVCHIFTDTPATLADLHNTGLHLHVLAPVKVGNETAWYAAPLSR